MKPVSYACREQRHQDCTGGITFRCRCSCHKWKVEEPKR